MTSKECLEEILSMLNYEQIDECDKKGLLRTIKQDLDKLEQLEKENQGLKKVRDNYSDQLNYVWNIVNSLKDENTRLKQALEKACERLDDDCPVSQELIDDLDCENCNSNCKECWKKFFLKQVFESVGGE